MEGRRIVVLATLDTKAEETHFLAECIRAKGGQPWLVDLGIGGLAVFPGDTARQTVAQAVGVEWGAIAALPKEQAMVRMASGGAAIVGEMVARGEVAGVVGLGGGQGTWLGSAVMRALPLGLPKLMVSTVASRDVSAFVGHSDLVMMPTVVDVAGLNSILRAVLENAAGAICGMASGSPRPLGFERACFRLALTMFGVTTTGGARVRAALEATGYEVVVFHANGVGGATMEELIGQGYFAGVVDWTITELADELVGGIRSAGPHRLEAAGARDLPQVVVPGAIEVVNFGPRETVPTRFAGRRLHFHTPNTTLLRTSAEESVALGRLVAAKLNRASGPVIVLVPLGGFSALDAPGGPFEDPVADVAFAQALRTELRPGIVVRELPEHINSESFAQAVVDAALSVCPAPVQPGDC